MMSHDSSDSTAALSVGILMGGTRASREWDRAVTRVAQRVAELREGVSSPLSVNVVYQIPGEVLSLDFEGVRTGRFSKKESLLLVQVALPESPEGDADAFVARQLNAAVELAEGFAKRRRLIGQSEELTDLRELVRRVERAS